MLFVTDNVMKIIIHIDLILGPMFEPASKIISILVVFKLLKVIDVYTCRL